jgi:hypothetical protein
LQALDDSLEQRQRPPPLKDLIGCGTIGWFKVISLFCGEGVQRYELTTGTSFKSLPFLPFVGQEVLEPAQEKAPEPSLGGLGAANPVTGEQTLEKFLS